MTAVLSTTVRTVLELRPFLSLLLLQHRDGLRNGRFNAQRGRRICPFTKTPINTCGLTHSSYVIGTGESASTANATESSNQTFQGQNAG